MTDNRVKDILDNRVKDILKEIIKKQHRAGFFTMESYWDKILIFIISLFFKKKNMGTHVYNIFLRRRYWYTYVICGIIKEIIPESVVVKKGEELCKKWEKKIGLREYTEKQERDIIINREFARLSATTIDVIPHAILSNYAMWKDDTQVKEIFDDEVYSIISEKYTIEDPADFFWALQIWMKEKALNTSEYSKEMNVIQGKLNEHLRNIISDNDTGYFKPPKVPSWDSTPEIYCDIRTTLYILINLIHIKKALKEGETGEKVDTTIKKLSNWVNKQGRRIHQNPYFSALLLKYEWDEVVKTETIEEVGGLKQELKNIEENFKKEKIREIIKKVPKLISYIIALIAAVLTIGLVVTTLI